MNPDTILLFTVIPLFASFVALIEKAVPALKVAKPIALLSFVFGSILVGLFGPGIHGGEVYTTVVGGWPLGIGISQQLDGLAWVALALTYLIYLPVLLFSFSEGGYDCRFYFFLLLLQGGMAGIVLAYDVFNLFVFLEITGIAAYTLIAYQKKERALFAGFKYLMLSSLGITLFLLGVFIFYRDTGSLQYDTLRSWAQASSPVIGLGAETLKAGPASFSMGNALLSSTSPLVRISTSFALATLLAGIGVRTAFLPYTWLPDAHGFAPHPISASLSGVVIKVSFIVVWKLITLLQIAGAREFLLWMGSAIALIGVLRALTQTDVKVLLAWHSVSQMGYVFAGFGAGTEMAVTGSLYHMVGHAFFKALLFLSVGTVILFTGERSLKKVWGMGREFPFLAILFAIGALSIMGVPPFVGYVSKSLIFDGIKEYPLSYWMLFAASVGTVASFTKLSLLFRGPVLAGEKDPGRGRQHLNLHTGPLRSAYVGLSILAVLCIGGGLLGAYGMQFFFTILFGEEAARSIGSNIRPISFLWYRWQEYLKTIVTLLLGYGVYRFIVSKKGKELQARANRLRISFDNQMVLLKVGLLLLTAFLII